MNVEEALKQLKQIELSLKNLEDSFKLTTSHADIRINNDRLVTAFTARIMVGNMNTEA